MSRLQTILVYNFAMEERRQSILDDLFLRGQELCNRTRVPIREQDKAEAHRDLDRRAQSLWTTISWLGCLEKTRSFFEQAQRAGAELAEIEAELTRLGL